MTDQMQLSPDLDIFTRNLLDDPKTFGEKLEIVVEECISKKRLCNYVLCLDNKVLVYHCYCVLFAHIALSEKQHWWGKA